MPSPNHLLANIQKATQPLSLPELLKQHPDIPRRTLQRWLKQLVDERKISIEGKARARRYFTTRTHPLIYHYPPSEKSLYRGILRQSPALYIAEPTTLKKQDVFPSNIPLSPDSLDILTYINQPLSARKKVGYQQEFLASYQPNKTSYLSPTLCSQLEKMGNVGEGRLPAGTYGREILNRLLIDLSWASSHLEGNTYSLLDTKHLIEQGKAAAGKNIVDARMILNHKTAIEFLIENAENIHFNRYTIFNLQSTLAENLLPNRLDEGRLRQHAVYIGKSNYHPLTIPAQISDNLDLLLEKAEQIINPFEQSFFVMVHLPYLQAFADVNKRTSRLAANIPLIRANLCPLTFLGVPEQAYSRAILGVYELNRIELLRDLYLWAYEQSVQAYITQKRDMVAPDPIAFAYREIMKQIIRDVITHPDKNTLAIIQQQVNKQVSESDRDNVRSLIIEELRRMHEGVLARYGVYHGDFLAWKAKQKY